jgi:streptogramin lyase
MRRGLLAGVVAALLLAATGSAAPEKSPSVSLTARPSGLVVGRPWTAVLAVRGSRPSRVGLTATSGSRRVATSARRWRKGRYRGRLVFRAAGRWTLTARLGRKRFRLGTVAVRAATRPPVVLVAPTEAVLEPNGSILVAESGQSRLARIDPATGRDTLVARIVQPYGVALTPSGVLYSTSESRVVRVESGGSTTTIADAGEDVGPIALDPSGNLYFSTVSRIFRIESGTGAVTHYAGTGSRGGGGDGGPALAAELDAPHGLVVGSDGALYVADTGNHRVRRIDPATRVITAFAAAVGPAGLALGSSGVLYLAERDGQRVSRIEPTGAKTVVAGTGVRGESGDGGPAVAAQVDEPFDVVPASGSELFIVESGAAGGIRHIDASGVIRTIRRR